MLSSTQTRLTPDEVIAKAYDYFVEQHGLVPVERAEQLYGTEGAVEIAAPGTTPEGRSLQDSDTVFSRLTGFAQSRHRLTPVHALLHLHAPGDDDPGDLLVQASFDYPVEVRIETQDYEHEAKEFMTSLPR